MADTAVTVAVIATVPAVLGGMAGAWAGFKQRSTTNLQLVIESMQSHMNTLGQENADLRVRMRTSEERQGQTERELVRCETDKVQLQARVDHLEQRLQL